MTIASSKSVLEECRHLGTDPELACVFTAPTRIILHDSVAGLTALAIKHPGITRV